MYKMSHHRLHHHPDIYKERKTHLKHSCFGLEYCYCHHTESLAEESSTPNHNQKKKLHSADTRCVTTTSKPYSTFSLNQSSALDRVIALRGNKTASHLLSSLSSAKRSEAASSSDANKTKINKSLLRKTATRTQTQRERRTHARTHTEAQRQRRQLLQANTVTKFSSGKIKVISGDAPRREEYKEMISEGRGNACLEMETKFRWRKSRVALASRTIRRKTRGAKRLTDFSTARRLRFPKA